MDAVALISAAGDYLAQEGYLTPFFGNSDVVVPHAGQEIRQLHQFVVMSGKQRFCAQSGVIMDILGNCLSNRKTIVGRGAAPYLVENNQRLGGGVVEYVGSLHHLNHEGGLPGDQVILKPYAGEDAVNQPDGRRVGGDEAAYLS